MNLLMIFSIKVGIGRRDNAEASEKVALNRYASLFASFDGEFSNSGHSYGGRGGIRFSW
jgi:hypothetical protein